MWFKNRFNYPEFKSLIDDFDIICVTEITLDDCDLIYSSGIEFVFKNRHSLKNCRSGGIALGFKKNLEGNISTIETDCKYVLWFKVNKRFLIQRKIYILELFKYRL